MKQINFNQKIVKLFIMKYKKVILVAQGNCFVEILSFLKKQIFNVFLSYKMIVGNKNNDNEKYS